MLIIIPSIIIIQISKDLLMLEETITRIKTTRRRRIKIPMNPEILAILTILTTTATIIRAITKIIRVTKTTKAITRAIIPTIPTIILTILNNATEITAIIRKNLNTTRIKAIRIDNSIMTTTTTTTTTVDLSIKTCTPP